MAGKALAVVLLALFAAGCARISITKLHNEEDYQEGVRFFRPSPYLWIVKQIRDGKEVVENKIVWLPDLSEEYVARVVPGIGSADFKPTLEGGWMLTGFDVKTDSKVPEMIGAVSGLVATEAKLFRFKGAEKTSDLKPGLYRFIFDLNKNSETFGKVKGIEPVYLVVE